MAKKRKLRSSEPEPVKLPESEPAPAHEEPQEQPRQEEMVEAQPSSESIPKEEHQVQVSIALNANKEEEHCNLQENMAIDGKKEEDNKLEESADAGVKKGEETQQEGEEEGKQQDVNEGEGAEDKETGGSSNEGVSLGSAQPEANGSGEGKENGDEGEVEELEEEPLEKLLEPFTKEQLFSLVKQAVEKYPDFVESVQELAEADPAHRKIFVHGLGWDTTAETLTSAFGKYGEIEDCKAVTDRVSGKSKGYAFILFKHRSGARKALKQPQKIIGNRTTSCQLASAGPVPAPPPVVPPVSEYTQRKIFVSNVSADVDPQKLLEFFKQYGEIEDGPLGLDKQTGKPKGFALFVYKSLESAKKALEEPHKNFEGHTLHCQKAIDGPKSNKPYHQHQQQQQHQHQHPHQHQHHTHHHQPHYHARKEKNKYPSGGSGSGHLMAPSGPAVGYNPGVAAQGLNPALGQALTALIATQGAGLGLGNIIGGIGGAPVNQAGPPAGYGNQVAGGFGNQPGMQPGYQNPHMGQGGAGRPHPGGGAPYMGH